MWQESKELVTFATDEGGKKKGDDKLQFVFVPFVSKAVADEWQKDKPFPIAKIRLRALNPKASSDKERLAPPPPLQLFEAHAKLTGVVKTLDKEEQAVRDGLAWRLRCHSPRRGRPVLGTDCSTKEAIIMTGVLFILVGLAFIVPFVLRLVRKKPAVDMAAVP